MVKDIGFMPFNMNPHNNETNDCVIRAIALYRYFYWNEFFADDGSNLLHLFSAFIFDGYTNDRNSRSYGEMELDLASYYETTYRGLFHRGLNNSLMLNDERNYIPFLTDRAMKEYEFRKNTIRLKDLCKDEHFIHNRDSAIVNLNGHLTVVIGGILFDTFDCRNEYAESIFVNID